MDNSWNMEGRCVGSPVFTLCPKSISPFGQTAQAITKPLGVCTVESRNEAECSGRPRRFQDHGSSGVRARSDLTATSPPQSLMRSCAHALTVNDLTFGA